MISHFVKGIPARHKTNANYENLVTDKVEKRVTKHLLCDLDLEQRISNQYQTVMIPAEKSLIY